MFTSPESLDSWFRESGVVDRDTNCQPSDLEKALDIQEAIYSLVTARMVGKSYDEGARSLVNQAARTPPTIPQLTAAGRRIEATPGQAMSSVARDAIDILTRPQIPLLKECANPECAQVYIDHSRGARREWCPWTPAATK
jgi:predicted RNA-binding Zn ribbon-like protein